MLPHPQHPLLQSPQSVPQSSPGLGGCVFDWETVVPLFLSPYPWIWPQHCPQALLHPWVSPQLHMDTLVSHPKQSSQRSRGRHFSQLPCPASLGRHRFLWSNLELQAPSGGLLDVGREWLFLVTVYLVSHWKVERTMPLLPSGTMNHHNSHLHRNAFHGAIFHRVTTNSHNNLIPIFQMQKLLPCKVNWPI